MGIDRVASKSGRPRLSRRNYLALRLAGEWLENRALLSGVGFGWTEQFGTPEIDSALGVAADGAGSAYVVGATRGLLGQTSLGGRDAYVRQYTANGNEIWTRQFGTSGDDVAWDVVSGAGSTYVGGWTSGTFFGQSNAGSYDAYLSKFDADGNEIWTRQFGSSGFDTVYAVTVNSDGAIYVAGYAQGGLPGQTHSGRSDAFIRKYDSNGDDLWTRQFGSSASERAFDVAVDDTGVYVAGPISGTLQGETSAGSRDGFLRKYDSNGNELWTDQFGTLYSDFASSVTVNDTGVYVAGFTAGVFPGEPDKGGVDSYVRKYDGHGEVSWTRQFGSSDRDRAWSITSDHTGVYVGGITVGPLPGQIDAGERDAFARKYNADGDEVWTHQYGSSGNESYGFIAADGAGSAYVAGITDGTFPGQTSAGKRDAFMGKLMQRPTVESIRLAEDRASLIVQLNNDDLALASAENVNNYRLFVAGGDDVFDTADDVTVSIASIGYDAAADQLMIHIGEGLPGDLYRLELDGDDGTHDSALGIVDVDGNFLQGGDYTAVLNLYRPKVLAVNVGEDLDRLIIHMDDNDLDPTLANEPANYRIVAAKGDLSGNGDPFDDGDEEALTIASVFYDPVSDTIELRVAAIDVLFGDVFRLEIDGDGLGGPDFTSSNSPGVANAYGSFLSGGDFRRNLDLTGSHLTSQLIDKAESLGLSTGTESSLTAKLEAALVQMGVEVHEDTATIEMLNLFIDGVWHWYERGEIDQGERNDLIADAQRIIDGLTLTAQQ